ncbi:hypothetical protein GOBAR_AA29784 [Gossypium barbadense]|uniref:Neprosin domain-containing protein n=1 Tax=Gossypium barbadense TaxID=3634 RepID=A0A2P5WIJ4_GOSBA|nr:hypothetical protein GOBAR_AA29784 [Gossypium barbadense]
MFLTIVCISLMELLMIALDLYGGASAYGDITWRSSTFKRDGSGSFGYGLGSATYVSGKNSPGYVSSHKVNKRQASRGIAT